MTVKELVSFLSEFDDDTPVYIDVNEGYWDIHHVHTFRTMFSDKICPAINCTYPS